MKYSTPDCRLTLDTSTGYFSINYNNCIPPISSSYTLTGKMEGTYNKTNLSFTVTSENFEIINEDYNYEYKLPKGYHFEAEYTNDDKISFKLSAPQIIVTVPEEKNLPCFSQENYYYDISAKGEYEKSTNKALIDASYKLKWPPCINSPVSTDFHYNGTEDDYGMKIANGKIEVKYNTDNCVIIYNGKKIFDGSCYDLADQVKNDLGQTCVINY